MNDIVFFLGVRALSKSGKIYIDKANKKRIELILSPFNNITIYLIKSYSLEEKELEELNSDWKVFFIENESKKRGSGTKLVYFFKMLYNLIKNSFEVARIVSKSINVGVIFLIEPANILAFFWALVLRKNMVGVVNGMPHRVYEIKSKTEKNLIKKYLNIFLMITVKKTFFKFVDKSNPLLVTGNKLKSIINKGIVFQTAMFDERDIYQRDDTCEKETIWWIYSGVLGYGKGTDVLLDAFLEVSKRETQKTHKLRLVGKVAPDFPLKKIISNGRIDNVIIEGYKSWTELKQLLRSSDIYIFPSLHEGLPKAPLEALSQGLPVVATNTGADAYIIDRYNGLLIPHSDRLAIVEKVSEIVNNKELRKNLIINAIKTAEENSYKKSIDNLMNKYSSFLPIK